MLSWQLPPLSERNKSGLKVCTSIPWSRGLEQVRILCIFSQFLNPGRGTLPELLPSSTGLPSQTQPTLLQFSSHPALLQLIRGSLTHQQGTARTSSCVSTCQVSFCGSSVLWLLQMEKDTAGDSRKSTGSVLLRQHLPAVGHWQVCLSFPLSFTLRRCPLILRLWLWGKYLIYWAFNGRIKSHMKT